MAETRTLRTETQGRYLVEARPGLDAPLLLGFHGYGQNAEHLLEALTGIPGAARCTHVSVQGLHRFYNTKTQEIVASWMTSQDREQAIADNLAYVSRVISTLRAEGCTRKLVLVGFSQGTAMAWRAAAHLPCDGLLVLGGDLPKDVADAPSLALPPILIGRGDQDTFYRADQLDRDLAALETRGIHPEVCRFAGGHEWGEAFLEAAGRFLARTLG